MNLREATPEDVDGVRTVARASLEASYGHAVPTEAIGEAVEAWYDAGDLADELADEDVVFVVAEDAEGSGRVAGFAQSYVVDRREPIGAIDWLHVHPDYRERGVGTDLLRRVESELHDRGATRIEGRVLVANEAGTGFYEEEGFTEGDERTVEIGDESFRERRYTKLLEEDGEAERIEPLTTADGSTLYVAYDEAERASKAPFYATYAEADRTTREGYRCGNCGSVSILMDSMGTVSCPDCGNRRKPVRWDAAYL
ncbi:GNAT family N-acetyltransferase [Halorarum salinum]|uniref:GNAT family N-acetyltransferase n=1 Tax=Halorarum salinum TaxID=2743089 RepID=A0A7D5L870_9EURY|nr:GNAT family N-acetyltransferase [Halobaculum salinum]QLG60546.1 GNAT family N-acetyltransferase [Halobaculum salinum]